LSGAWGPAPRTAPNPWFGFDPLAESLPGFRLGEDRVSQRPRLEAALFGVTDFENQLHEIQQTRGGNFPHSMAKTHIRPARPYTRA
jgi:hypothetical protein